MSDLEPFLSEIDDERLPLRCRLGSLHYLQARQDFMTREERRLLDAARDRLHCILTEDVALERSERPREVQVPLFPDCDD